MTQELPLILKSLMVSPVTDSENVNVYSKVKALFGEVGEVTVTVGAVRSITTSVLVESALGPLTVPVIELASKINLYVPVLQPDAVTR
jgi:hypothetical protein